MYDQNTIVNWLIVLGTIGVFIYALFRDIIISVIQRPNPDIILHDKEGVKAKIRYNIPIPDTNKYILEERESLFYHLRLINKSGLLQQTNVMLSHIYKRNTDEDIYSTKLDYNVPRPLIWAPQELRVHLPDIYKYKVLDFVKIEDNKPPELLLLSEPLSLEKSIHKDNAYLCVLEIEAKNYKKKQTVYF
jgi:hypothetical protein